uniref:Uncharacterized protein n=1 Tax=Oryzias sinensis TaxID=183150 RepID=A0A8C7XUM3_9TELE
MPVVSRLEHCSLSAASCAALSSALKSSASLVELDLSFNVLQDSGVKDLLQMCRLSEVSCAALAAALKPRPSCLTHLDLSNNDLHDAGVKQLCSLLEAPPCSLDALKLSKTSCSALLSALKSNPTSHLRELDLRDNNLQDSAVKQLSNLVESPHHKLDSLRSVEASGLSSYLLHCWLNVLLHSGHLVLRLSNGICQRKSSTFSPFLIQSVICGHQTNKTSTEFLVQDKT